MKKIAILMTVHNRRVKTIQCLENLFKQVGICVDYTIEVYLTDDGCSDGTSEAVRKQFQNINVIDGDGTLFWNRGMFAAWEEASKKDFDYYLWLNDDTFLYDDSISVLYLTSLKYNDIAIIVGPTQTSDHSMKSYGGVFRNDIPAPVNGDEVKCDTFNGNIVLVPRNVYKKLGNLDYYYRHSSGDTDYGRNATKNGVSIIQVGKYLGECDLHTKIADWCDPNMPIGKRIDALLKPTGMPPHEQFHYDKKYNGNHIAIIHYFTIWLRCIFPKLWFLKSELYDRSKK